VFAIAGFLAAGSLYALVWTGHLDKWRLPGWVRAITGRDADPLPPEPGELPAAAFRRLLFRVEVPVGLDDPVRGEGPAAVYGSWRLFKVDARAGAEGPARDVLVASGDLAAPGEGRMIKVEPAPLVCAGEYRFDAGLLHARGGTGPFTVSEDTGGLPLEAPAAKIARDTARLRVVVRPARGTITLKRTGMATRGAEAVDGGVLFGGEGQPPLECGHTYEVEVAAPGYRKATQPIHLLDDPSVVDVPLEEDAENRAAIVVQEIRDQKALPPKYENDAIRHHPLVRAALASLAMDKADWARAEEILANLEPPPGSPPAQPLPEEVVAARRRLDQQQFLKQARTCVEGPSAKADSALWWYEKARPDLLPADEGKRVRADFAEAVLRAWVNTGGPGDLPRVRRVAGLLQEIPAESRASVREELQAKFADVLLTRRTEPLFATAAGPGGGDAVPDRGEEAALWLDLAREVRPAVENDVRYRVLRARLADLGRDPAKAVDWFRGIDDDVLVKRVKPDDRLLYARALRLAAEARDAAGAREEAEPLWNRAWAVYQTLLDREGYARRPEALWEASLVARRVKGRETTLGLLNEYLKIRPRDVEARAAELLAALREEAVAQRPTDLGGTGVVEVPGGPFRLGPERPILPTAETPHDVGGKPVRVTVLPARRVLVRRFWVSKGEVNAGSYREYLQKIADPKLAELLVHPAEPASKKAPGAREPAVAPLSDDEPVRGVDWWDAYAFSRFRGGRLPTEAEWEKAARFRGTPDPGPDREFGEIARVLGTAWAGLWTRPGRPGANFLDAAPGGAVNFLGGVSEWTLDAWSEPRPGDPGAAIEESLAIIDPPLGPGKEPLLVVRGGSFYHRPPGDPPGPTLVREKEPPAKPLPAGTAPPSEPVYRAIDVHERRQVPAGTRARWLGFRVVYGPEGERVLRK